MLSPELTNLVPHSKTKLFRREYFIRLVTVSFILAALFFFIQCILLLPSYIYETQAVSSNTDRLSRLSADLATTEDQQVQTRLAALQTEATHLQSLGTAPSASATIKAVLLVPRPGIVLSGFSFTPPTETAGTMQVSGVAGTREQLRSFDAALAALPFVKAADLPISNYAKESNIPFTITLSFTKTPSIGDTAPTTP